ncbi:ribonuclease H [Candidatus Levyibacteriota bacterium]|nr:ribonuclease HI family protein [Candidatus Levybacteria bacterium]MSU26141.1 ribonuclease HI family protein [Candidatus Levybacteria bacterium]GDX62244.1 ribonuclease H [Candidatus Levybacteria bacterium]
MITIFTDGGSRGNPGPAATGAYVTDEKGNILYAEGKRIGIATNNVAEYMAVIDALSWLSEHKNEIVMPIMFFMDSLLVVSQIQGVYRVRTQHIGDLLAIVRKLEKEISLHIIYRHVRREKNKQADRLVNMALDNIT